MAGAEQVFISPADLMAVLADENLRILDVRFTPEHGVDHTAYLEGHLPGAHLVDFVTDLASAPTSTSGRRPMPTTEQWQSLIWKWGIGPDSTVVVYDDRAGLSAARAWWLLKWSGVPALILDGGLASWRAADGPINAEPADTGGGTYRIRPHSMPVLDADSALALATRGVLLDARKATSYQGSVPAAEGSPVGHIPGAHNYPAARSLTAGGDVLPIEVLRRQLLEVGADGSVEVGVYCGGGVAATHVIAALSALGIPAALYPGSWSEWVRDPNRPVEVAAQVHR